MGSQVLGELCRSHFIDGRILRVPGLAAAIEDVSGVAVGGEGEDAVEGLGTGGVGLHEARRGAGGAEFGREAGKLGEDFVDEAEFGGEGVGVDVVGQEAADIACGLEEDG